MPQDFLSEVTRPSVRLGSQAWYMLPLSILAHAAAVAVVVIVPLMATDVLPMPDEALEAMVVAPPSPEPPPAPATRRAAVTEAPATAPNRDAAPIAPPDTIAAEVPGVPDVPNVMVGPVGPGGIPGGTPGGTGIVGVPAPPPPAAVLTPVRPGGKVKYPAKVRDARPVYPPIAVHSGVEGRVMIEAIIGVDGRVKDARVLRSIPLLDRAALEAVQQWRFTPTLLNGIPVPVIITVTVDFKLR